MANKLRWAAVASLVLLANVAFFNLVMLPGLKESLMIAGRKGIRGQEMGAVKESRERVDEVVVTFFTRVTIPREVHLDSGYHRLALREAKVDETESENGESGMSFRERKIDTEFESKRVIPGGPDGQHHL